jgi:mycothiol S-conjugate amidase
MTRRLLFVHAHPDDEASKGAATAARYLDAGAEVVLVTCTGGEAGEVLNPRFGELAPERMAEVRAAELAAAVEAVGFTRAHVLGYLDSGYHEDPARVPEGTFARVPLDLPARDLAAILRRERPQVVVTYPEDGGYPHPDHIRTHEVTMRAVVLAADPDAVLAADPDVAPDEAGEPWQVAKVYASHVFTLERLRALRDAIVALDPHHRALERLDDRLGRRPPVQVDARVDCAAYFDRRDAALRAHASQVDPDGHWFVIPADLERDAYPYEAYTLLHSEVPVSPPEDDLFAGIDTSSDT